MAFAAKVGDLKGVGPSAAQKLAVLKIHTVSDLIFNYPRRYEDYSTVSAIASIKPGNAVTIKAKFIQATGRYVRRGMHITEAVASDDTGSIKIVWFNQPYRAAGLKLHKPYYISGNFELSRGRLSIVSPTVELESEFQLNTARIVPVYRETKGLKSTAIRKIIGSLRSDIEKLPEILPETVIKKYDLLPRSEAVFAMHFPESMDAVKRAKRRIGFEELFCVTLAGLMNKRQFAEDSGVKIDFEESIAQEFVSKLPYSLTNAQRKTAWRIFLDMQSTVPMNRLVEGDVGSGKTVVAALVSLMVLKSGHQVALMAPTELLARQHYQTLGRLLRGTEIESHLGLLIGSMRPAEKREMHERVKSGEVRFIIGTHALISDNVDMHKLGLVIIDEQHRFGVEQRKSLQQKAGRMPHVLSLTATPIPRTLALTVYGELDVSVIDELPPGRTPIVTSIVSPNSRQQMNEEILQILSEGRQAYVVCPLIEDSEVIQVLSAEAVYERLSKTDFKNFRVGLLHGKMKPAEKDEIMAAFSNHELDILVSTTVVEVGVDVPNASVMVIEGAERFGLAQLHQLRGRVGRGSHQACCFLVMSDSKEPPHRLRALESTTDGFKLAELDLELRGPGAIYGVVQSGQLDLRVANLSDTKLVAEARQAAADFLDRGEKMERYPVIQKVVNRYRSVTNLN